MASGWEKLKRIKDELSAERESSLLLEQRINRIMSKHLSVSSKVSHPKTRSDAPSDIRILKTISALYAKRQPFCFTAKTGRLVAGAGAEGSGELEEGKEVDWREITPSESYSEDEVKALYVRHWDHSTPYLKCFAYAASIPSARRYALTILIRPDIQARALRSPKGFVAYLQDRIVRALKEVLGALPPDFLIIAEGVPLEEFHLHGVINLSPEPSDHKRVAHALRIAAGPLPGPSIARQVHFKRIDNLGGWLRYLSKARLTTEENLRYERLRRAIPKLEKREGLIGATANLRRSGKAWFENARRTSAPINHKFVRLS